MSPQINPKKEQRIFYPAFDGGLNLSVPPESLQRNELREAVNVEFSATTGAMTVRGGLMKVAGMGMTARSVAPLPGLRGFLAVDEFDTVRYFTWNRVENVYGTLSGKSELSAVQWDSYYLVASGGKLQKLITSSSNELETIEASPSKCRQVFVRAGRVGVVTENNEIRFSAVGDCESWENDPNDDSTGQYLEIGYKDGMEINAVIPLSRDLIIFKSPRNEPDKGTIYRLTGDYPNWTVLEAAHNTGTFSPRSVCAVGDDVYYAGVSGIATLSAVTSYGEIKSQWPDRKVNTVLNQELSADAELWNIPVRQQLWVKTQKNAKFIWVFDYHLGIWTKFEYHIELIYANGSNDATYVFMGNNVYIQIDGKSKDDLGLLETEITANLKMGTLLTGNQVLVKRGFVSFRILPECRAELLVGKFRMNFSHEAIAEYIYDKLDSAYECEDKLIPSEKVITSRRQCIVRDWSITPEVKMTGGGCALSTMGLDIAEV